MALTVRFHRPSGKFTIGNSSTRWSRDDALTELMRSGYSLNGAYSALTRAEFG